MSESREMRGAPPPLIPFDSLIEAVPAMIWVAGPNKHRTFFNRAWLEFTGRSLEQELGGGWAENIHPEDFRASLDDYVRHVDARRPFQLEYRLRRGDGSYRWVQDRGAPQVDPDGKLLGYAGACLDIHDGRVALETMRREKLAAESVGRAKDDFLAMLGHEIRNPLGAIATAAELLDAKPVEDAQRSSALEVLQRQAAHLSRLVDELLLAGRIAVGNVILTRRRLDLGEVVQRTVHFLRMGGKLQLHQVEVSAPSVWIEGDETRLEQIAANLIANAVKYTPAGGRIAVSVRSEGSDAILTVEDSGIGIPSEMLTRIFDLFVESEPSADRSAQIGRGVSLTMVRRLVELHGGTVGARSDGRNRGSIFTVRLPLVSAMPGSKPVVEAAVSSDLPRRILLVEDNEDSRNMLGALLRVAGHEVHVAADGRQGIELAGRVRPEVALIDIGLPDLDGYRVAQQIRSQPTGKRLVMVALTGYGQPEDKKRAIEAGFDDHLVKPVQLEQLQRLIAARAPVLAR